MDFYCPRLRLAIEIDGMIHFVDEDTKQYDKNRQEYIETLGIQFLRFTNDEVFDNLDRVMKKIEEKVKEVEPSLNPSLSKREGL